MGFMNVIFVHTEMVPWRTSVAVLLHWNQPVISVLFRNLLLPQCSQAPSYANRSIIHAFSEPHSLSLALPVGPSSSTSTLTMSFPAICANSAFCRVLRNSVLRGSTSSIGFNLALFRILVMRTISSCQRMSVESVPRVLDHIQPVDGFEVSINGIPRVCASIQ